jgi:hypothetical protein
MTDDLLVHHVELSYLKDEPYYVITLGDGVMDDDPTAPALRVELGPTDMFESRAAEYGIDPDSEDGWDDILRLVLAPQGNLGSIEEQLVHPDHLFNAPTIEHARKVKLGQIRKAMGTRRLRGVTGVSEHRLLIGEATQITHSDAEDPIEFIKRTAPMSAAHIAVKTENIRRIRHSFKARRLGLDPDRAYSPEELEQHAKRRAMKKAPTRESAEKLAARLLGTPESGPGNDRLPPRFGTPSKYL